jgi:UDP-N-acetyl-D-mannosaminuronic acid dehydrogenase
VDPWFFVEAAPELASLIYQARKVNDAQPRFVVEKVKQTIGPLKNKKIAALGLAYKPEVDDLRESPAVDVVRALQEEGAKVKAWEPFKPAAKIDGLEIADNLETAISDADALILLVRHTQFVNLVPREIAPKTPARVAIDTVNGWDSKPWQIAGFHLARLGVNK